MTASEIKNRAAQLSRLPYSIELKPAECDGKLCYTASHLELLGCRSQGATPIEALRNLDEARLMYIEGLLEHSQDVPQPQADPEILQLAAA